LINKNRVARTTVPPSAFYIVEITYLYPREPHTESKNYADTRIYIDKMPEVTHHEQYMLHVSAGPTYNTKDHQDVLVNTEKLVHIASDLIDAKVHMRIKDYRGTPSPTHAYSRFLSYLPLIHYHSGLPKNSPSTSPYFSTPQHPYDRYSISFSFTLKENIAGDKLVFGNDFDHPIRDRLPPLFDKAFGIVKWWIDPGLDGDVQADEPYLYGALLSSINVLRIGDKAGKQGLEGDAKTSGDVGKSGSGGEAIVYEEGAFGSGEQIRKDLHLPGTSSARQKHFLAEQHRKDFTFEAGREYQCDFFNPYLDFNEFALKIGYGLPAISIIGHWDGQPLRYVQHSFLSALTPLSLCMLLMSVFGPFSFFSTSCAFQELKSRFGIWAGADEILLG
jgi:hypothetical protein